MEKSYLNNSFKYAIIWSVIGNAVALVLFTIFKLPNNMQYHDPSRLPVLIRAMAPEVRGFIELSTASV